MPSPKLGMTGSQCRSDRCGIELRSAAPSHHNAPAVTIRNERALALARY